MHFRLIKNVPIRIIALRLLSRLILLININVSLLRNTKNCRLILIVVMLLGADVPLSTGCASRETLR